MNVLNLFTGYFLILLLIQGFMLVKLDFDSFKDAGMIRASVKAKIIGKFIIALGGVLYLLRWSILG